MTKIPVQTPVSVNPQGSFVKNKESDPSRTPQVQIKTSDGSFSISEIPGGQLSNNPLLKGFFSAFAAGGWNEGTTFETQLTTAAFNLLFNAATGRPPNTPPKITSRDLADAIEFSKPLDFKEGENAALRELAKQALSDGLTSGANNVAEFVRALGLEAKFCEYIVQLAGERVDKEESDASLGRQIKKLTSTKAPMLCLVRSRR